MTLLPDFFEGPNNRNFIPTDKIIGQYVICQAPPHLPHLPGEKQDAIFSLLTGKLVAGPYSESYRARLFWDICGHICVRCYHWYNGPNDYYSVLDFDEVK